MRRTPRRTLTPMRVNRSGTPYVSGNDGKRFCKYPPALSQGVWVTGRRITALHSIAFAPFALGHPAQSKEPCGFRMDLTCTSIAPDLYLEGHLNPRERTVGVFGRRYKKPANLVSAGLWRRVGDSNPRTAFDRYTISSRAPSATRTTLPWLRKGGSSKVITAPDFGQGP
jgi:hypothetical protein